MGTPNRDYSPNEVSQTDVAHPPLRTVPELLREIHRQSELQRYALDRISSIGFTGEEGKEMEKRRQQILLLVDQLAGFVKSK